MYKTDLLNRLFVPNLPLNHLQTLIYTDGSCHTRLRLGAWVAIIFTGAEKRVLWGVIKDTTHHRMELQAVIEALEYLQKTQPLVTLVTVISDSQYVTSLQLRHEKLVEAGFKSRNAKGLPNTDLIKRHFELATLFSIEYVKTKAHQKKGDALKYNIEADKLSRKLLRKAAINMTDAASRNGYIPLG